MADNPKRVLQILTAMNRGGAETMVMNHYRALDHRKVQFDFLVHRKERGDYDDEIEASGGRIFRAFPIRPWNYLKYYHWLDRFFASHYGEFTAVHGHIQENSGFALRYAKKYGIDRRIASSHIADLGIDYKYLFRQYGKIWTIHYATDRVACGREAGKFLYGKRDFFILNNAIDSNRYSYNHCIRAVKRAELKIDANVLAIGNVARFCPQKNHAFIMQVFAELHRINQQSVLILVGDGPLINEIKGLAEKLGVESNIIFTGLRSDIDELLQAFDVFFMPSHYEGLPVSVIEAQAAGLPCVLSDTIDKQCDVTGNVQFLPLNGPVEKWIDAIIDCASKERQDCRQQIIDAGYDVNNNIKLLLPLYGIQS